jgi:hypothetical protein
LGNFSLVLCESPYHGLKLWSGQELFSINFPW